MAEDRLVLHVTPAGDSGGWKIETEGGGFSATADTKARAEQIAKEHARTREPSQVKVHKSDGSFDHESTYGDDPPEIEG